MCNRSVQTAGDQWETYSEDTIIIMIDAEGGLLSNNYFNRSTGSHRPWLMNWIIRPAFDHFRQACVQAGFWFDYLSVGFGLLRTLIELRTKPSYLVAAFCQHQMRLANGEMISDQTLNVTAWPVLCPDKTTSLLFSCFMYTALCAVGFVGVICLCRCRSYCHRRCYVCDDEMSIMLLSAT